MLIFIKWNEVNRRNKFSLSKSLFSVMEILYKKECQRIYCCCNYAQSCKNISCKHFNRKTLHDNFSVKKIVFDCNSFKYKQNRLSDARLMKNIVKKITCKWACITIFKQLQHSQTLSPSFKYTYTSLKQSQKTHFKKDLTRIILLRAFKIIHYSLYIFHVLITLYIQQIKHSFPNKFNSLPFKFWKCLQYNREDKAVSNFPLMRSLIVTV